MSTESRAQSIQFPLDILSFSELMKPELTGLSVLTAVCGFYMASEGPLDLGRLFYTALGTLLVGGAAGTLNQYLERDFDLLMRRTERRPLPSGRLKPTAALVFGIGLSFAGLFILRAGVNMLAYILALLTLLSYLFLYTPIKRKSPLNTIVGAIPGALPALIGWSAANGDISVSGLVFFGILFTWQIPHFLSLAWMYRKDYGRAGFKMLPVIDESGIRTARQIIAFSVALLLLSSCLTIFRLTGYYYLAGAIVFSSLFLPHSILFLQSSSDTDDNAVARKNNYSRKIFFWSLAYLPLLMVLMAIDKR